MSPTIMVACPHCGQSFSAEQSSTAVTMPSCTYSVKCKHCSKSSTLIFKNGSLSEIKK